MRSVFLLSVIAAACAISGCASPPPSLTAAAQELSGLPVATSLPDSHVPAAIPGGLIGFCLHFSDQCELPKNSAATIPLTAQKFDLLARVNRDTNAAIKPEDDVPHYGVADYWTIATDGYGDCEDFALTKRKALVDAGLPIAALRLAVVLTPSNERHAILTVATDHGDFVMDNFSDKVLPWTAVHYTWLSRQDAKLPWRWDMLLADNAPSAPIAATQQN
jgi:predicted transglutaminase-like cysteine proteinase